MARATKREYDTVRGQLQDALQNASADQQDYVQKYIESARNYSGANPVNNASQRDFETAVYKNALNYLNTGAQPVGGASTSTTNIFGGRNHREVVNDAGAVWNDFVSLNNKNNNATTRKTSRSITGGGSYYVDIMRGLDPGWGLEGEDFNSRANGYLQAVIDNLTAAQARKNAGAYLSNIADPSRIESDIASLKNIQANLGKTDDVKAVLGSISRIVRNYSNDPQAFQDYFNGVIPQLSAADKKKQDLLNQGYTEIDLNTDANSSDWLRRYAQTKNYHFFRDKSGNIRVYNNNYDNPLTNILDYNSNSDDEGVEGKGYGHGLIIDENGNVFFGDTNTIGKDSPFASIWNTRLNADKSNRDKLFWTIDYNSANADSDSAYLQALETKFGNFKGIDVSQLFQGDDKIFATSTDGTPFYTKDARFGNIKFGNNAKFYKVGDDGNVTEVSWDQLKPTFNSNGWDESAEQLGQITDLNSKLNADTTMFDDTMDAGGRNFWTAIKQTYGLDLLLPALFGKGIGVEIFQHQAKKEAAQKLGQKASKEAIEKEAQKIALKKLQNAARTKAGKAAVKQVAKKAGTRVAAHLALLGSGAFSVGIGTALGAAAGLAESGIRYANYDNVNENRIGFIRNILNAVANHGQGELAVDLAGVSGNSEFLTNIDYNNKKAYYIKGIYDMLKNDPNLWNQLSAQEKATFKAMKREYNSMMRNGGIIKAAKGTVLSPDNEELQDLPFENPSKTKSNADIAKLRARYAQSNDEGYGDELYRRDSSKAQMFKGDAKMTTADVMRLTTLAQDTASIVASFVPGAGTGVAAGLGVTSMITDLGADIIDPAVSGGEVAKNLIMNAGFAGMGLIPGAKVGKVVKNLIKWTPKIMTAAAGLGIALDESTQATFKKLGDGTQHLNREDWRNISHVLSLVAAGTRGVKGDIARYKVKKATVASDNVTLKGLTTPDGQPLEFQKSTIKEVNKALGEIKTSEEGAEAKALSVLKEKLNLTDEQAAEVLNSPKFKKVKGGIGKYSISEEGLEDGAKTAVNLRAIWNEEAGKVKESSGFGKWFADMFGGGAYTAKQRAILEANPDWRPAVPYEDYNPMIDWQLRRRVGGTGEVRARIKAQQQNKNISEPERIDLADADRRGVNTPGEKVNANYAEMEQSSIPGNRAVAKATREKMEVQEHLEKLRSVWDKDPKQEIQEINNLVNSLRNKGYDDSHPNMQALIQRGEYLVSKYPELRLALIPHPSNVTPVADGIFQVNPEPELPGLFQVADGIHAPKESPAKSVRSKGAKKNEVSNRLLNETLGYKPTTFRNIDDPEIGLKITNADKLNDVLVSKDGNSIFMMGSSGRIFVVADINGQKVPFYISAYGTSGKHKGEWYPFFGNTGNWLVKGSVDKNGNMNYHPKIDAVTKLLNDNLKLPSIGLRHKLIDSKYANIRLESLYPELKLYTAEDRFPWMPSGTTYNNLSEIVGHPRKNNVVLGNRIANKQQDGLFVEEITGIDASNVGNKTGDGWISASDHISQIIANIEKANKNK